MKSRIVIVGAGLVGSLLAVYLSRRGYHVCVYERRADMRKEPVEAGRSINLALSDRGIRALQRVGIAEDVLAKVIPMRGRLIHHPDGSTVFQPYGKSHQAINSISRGTLNQLLVTLAEKQGAKFLFGQKCDKVIWEQQQIHFIDVGGNTRIEDYDVLFGADGAYSMCRLLHMLNHDRFDYNQFYINCSYQEIAIPPGADGSFLMDKHALHIWPRGNNMLIALPNPDGSFTGTFFFPDDGSLEADLNPNRINEFLYHNFPDVVSRVENLARQFLHNPKSTLVTVRCFPWIRDANFCLIGDAAHAMVPFFGQGMNCGFEDCLVLDELISKHENKWDEILNQYQHFRKPDCDAISEMALENFVEMREKTADPRFILQKKIEAILHDEYPDDWIPAYTQVTFSPHIRYSEALRNGKRQEAIMERVMNLPDIERRWNDKELHRWIIEQKKHSEFV